MHIKKYPALSHLLTQSALTIRLVINEQCQRSASVFVQNALLPLLYQCFLLPVSGLYPFSPLVTVVRILWSLQLSSLPLEL